MELGLGRGGLELKLHEEQHKYIEAKSIEAKLKFNEAKRVELQLGRDGLGLNVLVLLRVQLQCNVDKLGGKYTEAEPRCTCPPHESTLQRSLWRITECNSNANFTRWKASTPRRSRGVLALPTSQICTKSVKSNTNYR